jgi:hypothetical protein
MSSKKAKKVRQLLRHLQKKAGMDNVQWEVYKETPRVMSVESENPDEPSREMVVHVNRTLDPTCGKAIYKQMKKRA